MKKLLAIAVLGLTVTSAHASSFLWSSASRAQFDGSYLSGTATGYLVYLGTSSDLSSLFTVDYTKPGTITPADSVQSKTSSTASRTSGAISQTYDDASSTGGDGSQVATGNKFAMFIKYTDSAGVNWYNFSSTVATMATDATGAYKAQSFAFDFGTKTQITSSSQAPTAGGGWYSIQVPEPSVAIMGLLGIGMLIRRRKA